MTGAPNKATPFPALPIQKCSASSEPSALSLSLAYSGDSAHHRVPTPHGITPPSPSIVWLRQRSGLFINTLGTRCIDAPALDPLSLLLRLIAYYAQQRVLCVTRTRVLKAVDKDKEIGNNRQ